MPAGEEKINEIIANVQREQRAEKNSFAPGIQAFSFSAAPYQPPERDIGGETLLGRITDVLQRGEYASASLVKDYLLAKPFNVKTAIKGLKGEQKTTYSDIVDEVFPDWSKWKRMALGFSLSIFGDPTTYIPGAAISKPVKWTGKTLKKTKTAQRLGKTKIAKAFSPKAGLPSEYYELKYYKKKGMEAAQERVVKDIKQLSSGMSREDMTLLSYFREHPAEAKRLGPRLKKKLGEIGQRFDDLIESAQKNNLIDADTATKWRAKKTPYLPHYYPESKQGIGIARGEIPPSLFEKAKKPSFLKKRTFETIDDAQRLSDQFLDISKSRSLKELRAKVSQYDLGEAFGKFKSLDLKDIQSYAGNMAKQYRPEKNIMKALGYRSFEDIGFAARKNFVDDVLSQFGEKVLPGTKVIPEGYGIYLPKGALSFYRKEILDPSFAKNFKDVAERLKNLRVQAEKRTIKKTTTESTVRGVKETGGPLKRLEQTVRDSLVNRGMTEGEANVYINKLKQNGAAGSDSVIKEITERTEMITESLGSAAIEGDLIDIGKLTDIQKKWMTGITKRVPTYMLPEEIAKDMNKATSFFIGDPAARGMLGLFDKAQNAWKAMATTVRLPFHLRNMHSNWWQAYASGIRATQLPDRLLQAAGIQSGVTKKLKLGDKVYDANDLHRAIEDFGIHGKGWIGSDIQRSQIEQLESVIKKGVFRKINPFHLGREFGTAIEDNARIAVFLDQVSKGKSFKEASQTVRKYLFDYTELSPFEKNVMRRALPFYTWSRKNIPLQIDTLLTQPKKYQKYAKAHGAFVEPETKKETKLKPEYFNEMLYVKSPFKTPKGRPLYMSIDLPPQELNRMSSWRHWLSSLSPAKIAFEIGFNKKVFPEISDIGEPLEKGRAPFWVAYLPDKMLKTLKDRHIVDKIFDKSSGKMILGMDKHWIHGIQGVFPFLSELNRMYAQPISLSDEAPGLKYKSYMTGLGFTALDLERQRENEVYKTMGESKKVSKFISQHVRSPDEKEWGILSEQ